jgi:hypothetical protein
MAEADLLAVARALVENNAYAAIEPTLTAGVRIDKVGPTAMALLEDTLAKGVVRVLGCLGGARPRRRVGAASSRPARVFEARAVPSLAFGPYAFLLVRWMTACRLGDMDEPPFDARPATTGDEILAYLAMRLVHGKRLEPYVAAQPGVQASALAWLGFPRSLAENAPAGAGAEISPPSFTRLLATPDGRVVVECLEIDLRARWARSATWTRRTPIDPAAALRIASAERATALAFLDAIDRSGAREAWDLATFFVEAGSRVLRRRATVVGEGPHNTSTIAELVAHATPAMIQEGPLRVRAAARGSCGALFHALGRMASKREQLALLRFFEDGYEDGQATLATWDALGKDGFGRAADVVRALSSLEPEGRP